MVNINKDATFSSRKFLKTSGIIGLRACLHKKKKKNSKMKIVRVYLIG